VDRRPIAQHLTDHRRSLREGIVVRAMQAYRKAPSSLCMGVERPADHIVGAQRRLQFPYNTLTLGGV